MADTKISALTAITGVNIVGGDLIPLVDISVPETKQATRTEFFQNTPNIQITGYVDADELRLDKTVTAAGTTGARTINKPAGTVNFAAAATSLVVTNSLVTVNSLILCTVGTNDTTMKTALAVAAAGSFTIFANAAATAETRVNWVVVN